MKLSIITLTYNNLEYTKKFIESLYKYTKDFELIIVDNGSTDGTVEYLQKLPDIKAIFNNQNLGFSKGNNQGIDIAEGEFIGFLNNDILLYPNWFEECEKIFKKENAAFVSPRHVNPHYHNVNKNNYLKYFAKNFHYNKDYEKSFDECQFSCVITKREVISAIGKFDEEYSPAFFEDNDYKYRAIEAGYNTFVANKVCFFHYGSVTSAKLNQNFEKNRRYYYNKHRFAEYLSVYAEENQAHRFRIRYFKQFPLNCIYSTHLFIQKVIRNLKRIFKG